jgi:dTDP-4-amino-4,6-dideoxygalactose transaminase
MSARVIPLFRVHHDAAMEEAALAVLRSGAIAAGPKVHEFSKALGELIGRPAVVTTNDMSNAIQIALRLSSVGLGDEVITSPFACMSTNAPIAAAGAKPAWADVDPQTGSMDPSQLEEALTPRCKALILYHLAGYPGHVEEIRDFCTRKGLALIEDCDNALLAEVRGRQVGTFGRFAIFSFYPNRQVNASEGGALSCARVEDAERGIKLRRYGIDLPRFRTAEGEIDPSCDIPEIGWAATFNNLCSALGLAQIGGIAGRVQRARRNAAKLDELFLRVRGGVKSVQPIPGTLPSYWVYLIRTERRDELLTFLKTRGVGASKLHQLNTVYSGFGIRPRDLPGCDAFMRQVLALPCGWWVGDEDLKYIADMIDRFWREA